MEWLLFILYLFGVYLAYELLTMLRSLVKKYSIEELSNMKVLGDTSLVLTCVFWPIFILVLMLLDIWESINERFRRVKEEGE